MSCASLTQKVSAYELTMIQSSQDSPSKNHYAEQQTDRYYRWQLPNIIGEMGLTQKNSETIWVGHEQSSHAHALFFSLLKGCLNHPTNRIEFFTKLKYCLYDHAITYLSLVEQKSMVETLSLAQYTSNLPKFLRKYPKLELLFSGIFERSMRDLKALTAGKMKQLKLFSQNISFSHFLIIDDNMGCLVIGENRFHIISHRKSVFIVQRLEKDNSFSPSDRLKTSGDSLQKTNTIPSSKKKFLYSTPKFILKSGKKESERKDKRIEVKSFDLSDHFLSKSSNHCSLKKEEKSNNSLKHNNFVKSRKKAKNEIPKSYEQSPQAHFRNGFPFQSLGSSFRMEIKKGVKRKFAIDVKQSSSTQKIKLWKGIKNPEAKKGSPKEKSLPKITFTYSSRISGCKSANFL